MAIKDRKSKKKTDFNNRLIIASVNNSGESVHSSMNGIIRPCIEYIESITLACRSPRRFSMFHQNECSAHGERTSGGEDGFGYDVRDELCMMRDVVREQADGKPMSEYMDLATEPSGLRSGLTRYWQFSEGLSANLAGCVDCLCSDPQEIYGRTNEH